jgi:hypothetical protein
MGYPEAGMDIALDGQGNAYVAGVTASTNFPLLHPVQSQRRGPLDAFVVKVSAVGALVYSTYLGGGGIEVGNSIAVDAAGNAYVAGQTVSTDLPVTGAFQQTSGGQYDAFVAKLSASGDTIGFLSYLGGSGAETASAIALDGADNIYLAGWSQSVNFPTVNGFQAINAGSYGAFIAKVTPGAVASAVSVSPNTGGGASQTFSFAFSNSLGAAGLTSVAMLVQSSTSLVSACSVTYNLAASTLALVSDAGSASGAAILPGSGSLQNAQCAINGGGSSVSIDGNNLTLNLAVTFQSAFTGARNIYMQASNATGSTGWQVKGTWTVAAGPPQAVSATPSSGSGSTQTFSFAFTDPRGFAAINTTSILIGTSLGGVNSCYLYFARAANAVYLANDAASAWLAPVTLGAASTQQNAQCSLSGAGSSVSASGNNLILNLALTFKSAYLGAKTIYMEIFDGQDSGWQNRGSWTVTDNGPPAPVSVAPSSGSGSSQAFSFQFTDPRGYAAIQTASILVGASLAGSNSCYVYFARAANAVYLADDAGAAWLAPVILGATATQQNTQCSIAAAASSVSGSGNTLTLTLALSFKSGYAGAKNVYMQVYDGTDSGWSQKGTWTATLPNVLGPVSVTPGSGTGTAQTFAFQFNDPAGFAAIQSASMIVGANASGTSNCYIFYARAANTVYLANDAGTAWLTPAVLGTSNTVQNSQCSINVAGSSASGSGNLLTVSLALTFKPAYSGSKNVYMEVYDGADSGWFVKGAWIVP